jgi:hypothetical protein
MKTRRALASLPLSLRLLFGAILLLCFTISVAAAPAAAPIQDLPAPTPYAVTQRGPHSRVWERTVLEPAPFGKNFPRKHTYTELATGLHHLVNGEWVDSGDQIQIQPQGGAVAQNGQHQLYLPSDLYNDALTLTTPDSKTLVSRPLGLAFADTQRNTLIAELKQGPTGQILPSGNQALYTNICTDCSLDLLVTYKLAGVESDLVIRSQLPDPTEFGFTNDVRLQWWTEFFAPPDPQKIQSVLPDGTIDETLDFGEMKMGSGKAFLVGDEGQPRSECP